MTTTHQIPVDPCDLFWEVSYINIASGELLDLNCLLTVYDFKLIIHILGEYDTYRECNMI